MYIYYIVHILWCIKDKTTSFFNCEDWRYFELPMPLTNHVTAFAVTHSDNYILSYKISDYLEDYIYIYMRHL